MPIFKQFTAILSSILSYIGTHTKLTNFSIGSVVRTFNETVAQAISELYAYAAELLKQGFPDTATGFWLDRWARSVGLIRVAEVKTEGEFTFRRVIARDNNITIPQTFIIGTKTDSSGNSYRFFTTAEAVLEAGQSQVNVPVIAEFAGSEYNLTTGVSLEMRIFISGIDEVTADTDWITINGAALESDDSLRLRYFLRWAEISNGSISAAYIAWAMTVAGVQSAWVDDSLPRGEGTVDLYITSTDADHIPSSALIQAVQVVLDQNRPITAHVLAKAPAKVEIAFDIDLTPAKNKASQADAITAEVLDRITAWFGLSDTDYGIETLGAGRDLVIPRLTAIIMATPDLYTIKINSITVTPDVGDPHQAYPGTSIIIEANEFSTLGAIVLSVTAESQE